MARVGSLIKEGMTQSPSDHLNSNSRGSSRIIGNYQNISRIYCKGKNRERSSITWLIPRFVINTNKSSSGGNIAAIFSTL